MPITRHKSSVEYVKESDSVAVALDRMASLNIGSLLVVRGERAIGIVTERDVLKNWRNLSRPGFTAQPISDIMSRNLVALPVSRLGEAAEIMIEKKIRHVPLTDSKGTLVGVISMRDLLANKAKGATVQPTPSNAGVRTLLVVCPEVGLEEACRQLVPPGWQMRVIHDAKPLLDDAEFAKTAGQTQAFFLDLDGLRTQDWRSVVRRFIQLLTSKIQPDVFLAWSPEHFSDTEMESIATVAKTADWQLFQRPLAVAALEVELQKLGRSALSVN